MKLNDADENKEVNLSFQYIGEDDGEDPISPDDKVMFSKLKDTLFDIAPDIKNIYSFNKNLSLLDIFDDIYSETPDKAISLYIKLLMFFRESLSDTITSYYLTEPFQEVFEPTDSFNMFDYIKENEDSKLLKVIFQETSYFSDILLENLIHSNTLNDINFFKTILEYINKNNHINNNPESLNKSEIRYICLNHFKDDQEICKLIIDNLKN